MTLSRWVSHGLAWAACYGILAAISSVLGIGGGYYLVSCLIFSFAAAFGFSSQGLFWSDRDDAIFGQAEPQFPEKVWFWLLVLLCQLHFFFIFYESRGSFWTRNPNNIGDLPMHIHFIRFFSRGGTTADSHPLLAGASFKYPPASNLWNAAFESAGVSTGFHLFFVGAIASLVLLLILKKWSGWWGILALIWSGGISTKGIGLGWGPGADLAWKNIFLSMWLTQRGLLFALPMGILLLHLHWKSLEQNRRWTQNQKYLVALLWMALPFFHLHSFLLVSFFLGLQCLHFKDWDLVKTLRWVLPLAVLPILRSQSEAGSAIHWSLNWMAPENDPWLFWFRNFSFWLVIPLVVILQASIRRRSLQQNELWMVALLGFGTILLTALMLAPWDWDQTKVFLWLYLYWNFLFYRFIWKSCGPLQRAFIVGLILFPGFQQWLSSFPAYQSQVKVWDIDEAEEMQRLVKDLSVNESVVVVPGHNHPILATGQQIWMGYEGHTWAHQVNSAPNKKVLEAINSKDKDSLNKFEHRPNWILIQNHEQQEIPKWKLQSFDSFVQGL